MLNDKSISLIISHSDGLYLNKLTHQFSVFNNVIYALNGLKVLDSILKTKPDLVIMESGLAYLNSTDIQNIIIKKKLKTKCIIIYNTEEEKTLFQHNQDVAQDSFLKEADINIILNVVNITMNLTQKETTKL